MSGKNFLCVYFFNAPENYNMNKKKCNTHDYLLLIGTNKYEL